MFNRYSCNWRFHSKTSASDLRSFLGLPGIPVMFQFAERGAERGLFGGLLEFSHLSKLLGLSVLIQRNTCCFLKQFVDAVLSVLTPV